MAVEKKCSWIYKELVFTAVASSDLSKQRNSAGLTIICCVFLVQGSRWLYFFYPKVDDFRSNGNGHRHCASAAQCSTTERSLENERKMWASTHEVDWSLEGYLGPINICKIIRFVSVCKNKEVDQELLERVMAADTKLSRRHFVFVLTASCTLWT